MNPGTILEGKSRAVAENEERQERILMATSKTPHSQLTRTEPRSLDPRARLSTVAVPRRAESYPVPEFGSRLAKLLAGDAQEAKQYYEELASTLLNEWYQHRIQFSV